MGDCDGNGQVTVDEVVQGVNIALASAGLEDCGAFDANGDGRVTVEELVGAVTNALVGCALRTPTATPSATPSPMASATPGPPALTLVDMKEDGVDGVEGIAQAISVVISRDGAHVYVAGQGSRGIAVFRRDPHTGTLAFVEAELSENGVAGVAQPTRLALSPDDAHLYVGNGSAGMAVFRRDVMTGSLAIVQELPDITLNGFVISPDGAHVHGTSGNVVLRRDSASGTLTVIEKSETAFAFGWSLAISPDGTSVYRTDPYGGPFVAFRRDPASGHLTMVQVLTGAGAAEAVVSPDGAHVYATLWRKNAVVVFQRDATTGTLSFAEQHDGLRAAGAIAISPDGAQVYAGRQIPLQIVMFGRDATTGRLTFLSAHDTFPHSDVKSIAVSPDSNYVYVAGGNSVLTFRVNRDL
ncbi:MAG: beta-propeller fold lactonase family protein [Candidatus Binatia bacterium]